MSKSSFEEQLAEHGTLVYTNVGDSMLPLIRENKDLIIIKAVQGRLKKFDVLLYKRDNGQYVLHRVLKVRDNDYVICGDNRYKCEYGITDGHIIGVLDAIVRNGRTVRTTDHGYKAYVFLWCRLFPIRAVLLYAAGLLKRICRRFSRRRS